MGPFIIIALLIYLVLIVISVCAYPFICATIATVCRRFKGIETGILLMLTIALYLYACTTLEHSLDNWCYSVYAGVVLTPIVLFISTGLEEPGKWPESEEKVKHSKITTPILTFLTSSLFTIEGVLRMADSYSLHKMVNYNSYWSYHDVFQYAGSLLFFVSLFSALIIGFSLFSNYKNNRRELAIAAEKKSRIEKEVNEVINNLKADSELLMSFESKQVDEAILYYNAFCQKIVAALESSDEKIKMSFEYKSFNNLDTTYKVLLLSNRSIRYYFYPMGIVFKNHKDSYNYIPNEKTTVNLKTEHKSKKDSLPYDVQPVHQFWQHSCRDGSPDLRYKYNPKTYVYEYGILRVSELILHVFRINTAKDVVNAYNKMYSYISQLKQQKHNEKMNTLSEEKVTASIIMPENKENITKAEQPKDNKKAKLQIEIKNPRTLEECFSVIISKCGTDILKDNKLVSIISSFKEVDVSEYKDVMDEMVSDNFLYQFIEPRKQNDFALYNLSSSYARQKKVSTQRVLFITQALVNAIKIYNKNPEY